MVLQVGDETGHDQQVNLVLPKDLAGDEMTVGLYIPGYRLLQGHEKMIPQLSQLKTTNAPAQTC